MKQLAEQGIKKTTNQVINQSTNEQLARKQLFRQPISHRANQLNKKQRNQSTNRTSQVNNETTC